MQPCTHPRLEEETEMQTDTRTHAHCERREGGRQRCNRKRRKKKRGGRTAKCCGKLHFKKEENSNIYIYIMCVCVQRRTASVQWPCWSKAAPSTVSAASRSRSPGARPDTLTFKPRARASCTSFLYGLKHAPGKGQKNKTNNQKRMASHKNRARTSA